MCKKTSLEWTLLGSQFDYWTIHSYLVLVLYLWQGEKTTIKLTLSLTIGYNSE